MKRILSLFLGLTFIGSMLLIPLTAFAEVEESVATTKGSVVLSGWGDQEQPEPNVPSGPQGESTLTNQAAPATTGQQGEASGKNFPKTNDSVNRMLSLLGLLMFIIGLLLLRLRQQSKVGETV